MSTNKEKTCNYCPNYSLFSYRIIQLICFTSIINKYYKLCKYIKKGKKMNNIKP